MSLVLLVFPLCLQGHPVALITAREAAAGLPAVISSAMRQFLPGVPDAKAAEDMPALLLWWQDEWQRAYGATAAAGTGAARPAATAAAAGTTPKRTPKGRSRPTEARGSDYEADSGATERETMHTDDHATAVTPPRTTGKLAAAAAAATPATAGRELRVRPAAAARTPSRPGPAGCGAALAVPVLVLQDADAGDLEVLQELVVALSEVSKRLNRYVTNNIYAYVNRKAIMVTGCFVCACVSEG